MAKKQPRKIFVQPNTVLDGSQVKLKEYDASVEGLIQSWVERFDNNDYLYKSLLELTQADAQHF